MLKLFGNISNKTFVIIIILFIVLLFFKFKSEFSAVATTTTTPGALTATPQYYGFTPVNSLTYGSNNPSPSASAITQEKLAGLILDRPEYNQWALFLGTQKNPGSSGPGQTPLSLICNIGESTLMRMIKPGGADANLSMTSPYTYETYRSMTTGVVPINPFFAITSSTNGGATAGPTASVAITMNLATKTGSLQIDGVNAQVGIFRQNEWGFTRKTTSVPSAQVQFTPYMSVGWTPSGYTATEVNTFSNGTTTWDCFKTTTTANNILNYIYSEKSRNMDVGIDNLTSRYFPEVQLGTTLTYNGIRTTPGCTGWAHIGSSSNYTITNSLLPYPLYPIAPYGSLGASGSSASGGIPFNYVLPTKLYSPNKMYSLRICHSIGKVCLFDYANNYFYTGGGLNEVPIVLDTTGTVTKKGGCLPVGCGHFLNTAGQGQSGTSKIYTYTPGTDLIYKTYGLQNPVTITAPGSGTVPDNFTKAGWLYKSLSTPGFTSGSLGSLLTDDAVAVTSIPNKSTCTIYKPTAGTQSDTNSRPSQLVLVGTPGNSLLSGATLYCIDYSAMGITAATSLASNSYSRALTIAPPTSATATLSSFSAGEAVQITLRDDGALYITGGPIATSATVLSAGNTKLYYRSLNTNYFIDNLMLGIGTAYPSTKTNSINIEDPIYDCSLNSHPNYNYNSAETGFILVTGGPGTIPGSSRFNGASTSSPPVTSDVYRGYVCWVMNTIFNNNPMGSDVLNYVNSTSFSVLGFEGQKYDAIHASPITGLISDGNRKPLAWADAVSFVTVGTDGSFILGGSPSVTVKNMADTGDTADTKSELRVKYKDEGTPVNALNVLPAWTTAVAGATSLASLMVQSGGAYTQEQLAAIMIVPVLPPSIVTTFKSVVTNYPTLSTNTAVRYRTFAVPETLSEWAGFYEGRYLTT